MKAYWIALYTKISNVNNLKKYSKIVTPIIKNYGGKPLVRGGKFKNFSGDEFPRTVIWEFESFKQAVDCHDSTEYQEGWSHAKDTTKRHLQIVEGFNTE
jgi:uncharacterized protein (DUF1330 family)